MPRQSGEWMRKFLKRREEIDEVGGEGKRWRVGEFFGRDARVLCLTANGVVAHEA